MHQLYAVAQIMSETLHAGGRIRTVNVGSRQSNRLRNVNIWIGAFSTRLYILLLHVRHL